MADKKIIKKEGGGDDGNKPLVLIIVWGGILLLLFGGLKTTGFLNQIYIGNISQKQSCQRNNPNCNIIGLAYKEEGLENSIFHYQKNVDVYQIIDSSSNSNLFYAATNHGIFFSQDTGKNWYPFSDFNKKIDKDTIVYKIIKVPNSTQEMIVSTYKTGKGTIYKSDNGLFSLTPIIELNNDVAQDISIFKGNLYLGLGSGKILNYSLSTKKVKQVTKLSSAISKLSNVSDYVLFVTTAYSRVFESNDGINFTQKNSLNNIKDITVSQDGLAIYITNNNGLSKSLDFGNNFNQVESLPLDTNKIEKVAASSMNHIYVFGNHQIYESLDGGATWKSYDSKINRTISTVQITNDRILVGTKSFNFSNLWRSLFQI